MALIEKEIIRKEIERRKKLLKNGSGHPEVMKRVEGVISAYDSILVFLDSLPKQPVIDHHEIEVEFRGEKVTVSREFYRNREMNYSTSAQDDNVIWAALRAWCEKKGITAFELYPKQSEQPVEGLEDDKIIDYAHSKFYYDKDFDGYGHSKFRPVFTREDLISFARHFAEWDAKNAN